LQPNKKTLLYIQFYIITLIKVLKNKIKAFTMVELITAIAIIWVLMMATTVYLWWTNEKRKVIEAQWCTATIWWEINNFVFYALTSKNLRLNSSTTTSPEYYIIQLTWSSIAWQNCTKTNFESNWTICDEIVLSYDSWDNQIRTYSSLSVWNTCRGNNSHIWYFWSWSNSNIKYVKMNKWFSITTDDPHEKRVFGVEYTNGTKGLLWDIIVVLCLNSDCKDPRQISKFAIDWRSETITAKNCKFYQSDDPNKCKERES
jgi:competence protein ComGC